MPNEQDGGDDVKGLIKVFERIQGYKGDEHIVMARAVSDLITRQAAEIEALSIALEKHMFLYYRRAKAVVKQARINAKAALQSGLAQIKALEDKHD